MHQLTTNKLRLIACSKRSVIVVALGLTLLLGGCSSFESKWETALAQGTPDLAQPAPVAPTGSPTIAATWKGMWHSEPSGHEGQLRCIVSLLPHTGKETSVTRRYAFHFHALWGWDFPAEYTIEMNVMDPAEAGQPITFEGEQDLGFLAGGVYRCEGKIEGDQFKATYKSKYDHGTFEMKLVANEE